MARTRWSKEEVRPTVQLLLIFIAAGALFGLLRRDGVFIGASLLPML